MLYITEDPKLTKEMIRYEKETGKKAIWRGSITEGFKKWQRGEKIYDLDRKGITIMVPEDIKTNWENFANENDFSTISKLIRKAVNFYINFKSKGSYSREMSEISSELKRPLTSIKGFSQLLIDKHKDEFSWEALLKIKEIIDNSLILENKIKTILEHRPANKKEYEILIVDDDESTINLLLNFFEGKGYKCKESYLGTDALEFLNKHIPKLILLDILLPDLNGYEICKTLKFNKEYGKFNDIPIFYITAVPEVEVVMKLKETGANGYFLKPFDFREFNILFEYLQVKNDDKK
ncbi:MAG: response regulator [Promethearchaeota archaeon]